MIRFARAYPLLAALVSGAAAQAAPAFPAPPSLDPLLPKGWIFLDSASADLDGNGTVDHVVMLSRAGGEPAFAPRRLLVVLGDSAGKLRIAKSRDLASVNAANAGASLDDRFQGLSAEPKGFWLRLGSGGGPSRSYQSFKFGWSRRDRTWQLVKVETETLEISPDAPDRTTKTLEKPPEDFGKIDIDRFDPDRYRGVGPR